LLAAVRKTETHCNRNSEIAEFLPHFLKRTIFPPAWSPESDKNTTGESRKRTSHLHGGQNPTKSFDRSPPDLRRCIGDVRSEETDKCRK
jgi:hypothetical protein